jgi:hypothetical protein
LYIADRGVLRKVALNGVITTLSEQATDLTGVAVDAVGNLYIADDGYFEIQKLSPSGALTTVTGQGLSLFSANGKATGTFLFDPQSVAIDAAGNLYIANGYLLKVTPNGAIATILGGGVGGVRGQ